VAIAFLVITRGQKVELRGSSFGTGGYRSKTNLSNNIPGNSNVTLQRNGNQPISKPLVTSDTSSPLAELGQSKAASTTAVLDLVTIPDSPIPSVSTAPTLSPQRLNIADTLDNISYRIIGLGFPLLTIGIIAGAVWANEAWGSYWSWDPKETWALITWLVFAAYLHARITRGWQGRRPAILAGTGLLVVWVCYLGVNLLGKGLHSYGWFF
ncbi:MAG: c-type cytochrome biogenesis protein CcsB, partial [Moorea sp. SIO2I5]|nr:c-type cytochrome biogenesis protein CcsB [Moorena sp. SIO2I5]